MLIEILNSHFAKPVLAVRASPLFRSPQINNDKMITVLVHYRQWVDAGHALLDGTWVDHSKVVEVFKLTDLNDMFRHITKIDILQQV